MTPEIDWSTAEVRDGRLSVGVTGAADKAWTARLNAILKRLDRGGDEWGEIAVKKRKVTVASVKQGAEANVRHLLEAAVMEVNAEPAGSDGDRESDGTNAEPDSTDSAMTAAFRSFAERAPGEPLD